MRPRLLAIAVSVCLGCVGVSPLVVDRHAQLENQILGRLQRLEADLILASSARSPRPAEHTDATPLSPLAREAIDAARRRAFNLDDIERFKDAGRLGEGRDGQLQILAQPAEPRQARWLRALVSDENHDRLVLMRRALQLTPELKRGGMPLVRRAFHRLALQTASPGQRVQGAAGRWLTVGDSRETEP